MNMLFNFNEPAKDEKQAPLNLPTQADLNKSYDLIQHLLDKYGKLHKEESKNILKIAEYRKLINNEINNYCTLCSTFTTHILVQKLKLSSPVADDKPSSLIIT